VAQCASIHGYREANSLITTEGLDAGLHRILRDIGGVKQLCDQGVLKGSIVWKAIVSTPSIHGYR
jgi:hypothetical protein